MAVFHADGLVIRSREYGESDRLITLFSRERGKLQAVAKGVRKPNSRQRAGALLFTYGDFLLHQGKTLHTVNQVSPRESFPHLWADLEQNMIAANMAELLDQATAEGQPQPELFVLTLTGFFLLEHMDPMMVLCAYGLRLMSILGYEPRLGECAGCGAEIGGDRLFFSPLGGGILCPSCRQDGGRYIRAGSVAFMRQLLSRELTQLDRLRWNEAMKQEIFETVESYCEQRLERKLRSWRMGSRIRTDVEQYPTDRKE